MALANYLNVHAGDRIGASITVETAHKPPSYPTSILTVMSTTFATYLRFFWAGLVKHAQTGGIMPSQRFLIAKMIAPVPRTYRKRIIELGAGTGALTLQLASRCREARIVACEINPDLARDHSKNCDRAGVNKRVELFTGSASSLLSELGKTGAKKPDFVISGIPLGNLGGAKALAMIDAIHETLQEGGMYIQFQHSLLDHKKIKIRFPKLQTVPAFMNFPPAFVYYASR